MSNKLQLTSIKELWTISVQHGTQFDPDERMKKMRPEILKRDHYACQYCGWRSKEFQEIHHIDHDHNNFKENNLITVCPLCHQIFHLPSISSLKGGEIIWLPELPQEVLNNLCINLFLAQETKKYKEVSTSLLTELGKRKEIINEHLGRKLGIADAGVFAEALIALQNEPEAIKNVQNNIRILPNSNRFKQQLDFWKKERHISVNNHSYFENFSKEKYKTIFDKYQKFLTEQEED